MKKENYWLQKFLEQSKDKEINIDEFLLSNGIVDFDFRERLQDLQEVKRRDKDVKQRSV